MFWSIMQKIFGFGRERKLIKTYTQVLQGAGYDRDEARRRVEEAVERFKQEAESEDLPDDMGDHIIKGAREGREDCRRRVERAKDEGATEEDIRRWWNRDGLQRRLICWAEEVAVREPMFETARRYGLSEEEAEQKVRQFFPLYGDPGDADEPAGEDRPLPHELRDRVERYRREHDSSEVREKLKDYSSYNALVRDEIRKGNL